jgi:uncharacterized protein
MKAASPAQGAAASAFPLAAGRSRLDGRGLFARGELPARRKLGEISGELVALPGAWNTAAGRKKIDLVQVSARRALDCSRGNHFKYLNHSCAPNCYLRVYKRKVEVYTLRRIEPGAELTVDYGETPHDRGMRCRCGAPACRGTV